MLRRPVASNIKYCIKYFYYLQDLSLEAFSVSPHNVTAWAMYALSPQTQSGFADMKTNLKRMTVLYWELLTSGHLIELIALAIKALAHVIVVSPLAKLNTEHLDQVIE